jgi:DNA helicase-2/ATP-dependent DNA helicase PcrA
VSAGPSDKKTGVPPWLDGIDGDHLPRLIESHAKVIRVVAGPGSGKTTGLKHRIQRLIEGDGIDPDRIFVGTFTRAIATELEKALGTKHVATLHSLAYRLLRENQPALGGRRLRFLLEFEEEAMLFDVGRDVDGDQNARKRDLRRLVASWAQRRELPDTRFWGAVERWLRHHGGMLIGEVPHLAASAVSNGDIAGGIFDEVVIDEYQDLTACEQQLVEQVWSGEGSLVVLGDDDQSIYRFRFNHPEGVTGFPGRWDEVEDISIPDNRRCGKVIVELANQLMAEAGSSKDPMIPRSAEGGSAVFVYWPSTEAEVAGLAKYILSVSTKEFLVLVPRRFIGYRLADAIGADARTSFRQEVLEHVLTQERFTLASLFADSDDRVAFRAWLGFDADEPVKASNRNSAAYTSVISRGEPVIDIARGVRAGEISLAGEGQSNIRARVNRLLDELGGMPPTLEQQISYLFDPNLADKVAEISDEKRSWIRRDLEELRDAATAIMNEEGDRDLATLIRKLRYRIATRGPLRSEAPARVRIMTLHAAKGLEADAIIVAGLADQIAPGPPKEDAAETAAHRAEQRRLAYVAVTRAKSELVVSWPQSVDFADTKPNGIRIDARAVRTLPGGRKVVVLTRSTLIPNELGQAVPGGRWLRELGI